MKKLSIVLVMFLILTGCSLVESDNTSNSIEDNKTHIISIETELTSLSDEIALITADFANFEPDELLNKVDSIYSRLTVLEDDLEGMTTEHIDYLEDEISALVIAFDALEIKVTSIESDTTLSDKISLLEILVDDLSSGNTLSESEINYIIENYNALTEENLGFRYYDNFNTEPYINSCIDFFYLGVTHDYCFETANTFKFYESSFSNVIYDIEDFKSDLNYLGNLLSSISNYDESPIIVGQNFDIETYHIGLLESNDTSLLFSASEDEITDDYLVVIAKDELKEILFIEAIVYQADPTNNLRIRIVLDYEYNLLEIQVESGSPESGGTMYYYTNYNDVQAFHHIKDEDTWLSLIQNQDYYVTTRMLDVDHSGEHIRVATYNDDGLIMMLDDMVTPMFMVHHTSFHNVKKVAQLFNTFSSEYIQYDNDTVLTNVASVGDEPTHMRPIPGQDHYFVGDTLTTQAITSILFYNETINIDPIETEYSITFKFDKTTLISLLTTYVDDPDYVLDLDLIEIESNDVYYRGFLLKD